MVETWENGVAIAFTVFTLALTFGLTGKLNQKVSHHLQARMGKDVNMKERLRNSWTNTALLGALLLTMSGANFVGGCPEDDCDTLGAKYYSLTNLYGVLLSFYATFVSAVSILYSHVGHTLKVLFGTSVDAALAGSALLNVSMGLVWMLISFAIWEYQVHGVWFGSIAAFIILVTAAMCAEHWHMCDGWAPGQATSFAAADDEEEQELKQRMQENISQFLSGSTGALEGSVSVPTRLPDASSATQLSASEVAETMRVLTAAVNGLSRALEVANQVQIGNGSEQLSQPMPGSRATSCFALQ